MAVDHVSETQELNNFLGLLLLLRIRSAHLEILGFPMGGAY